MATLPALLCDGCGQAVSSNHIARRLQRLELATRHRPVHISTLFLGACCPAAENEFLYSGGFMGEAGALLKALKISWNGKPAESVLAEFQKGGFFLSHILECPQETGMGSGDALAVQLARRAPAVMTRIRRSLKPKRAVLFSQELESVSAQLSETVLGCTVVLDGAKPFSLEGRDSEASLGRLREALLAGGASAR